MKISLLRTINLTPAQKIVELRLKHDISILELAAKLRLTVSTYKELENGNSYPTERMIRKIAKQYGLTYDEFLAVGENK
ncbi:helix-turn-helix transcriptional regulator [Pedobacter nyackensis]|uniref:helix-turn-helix domain-containing protein n=1 Tax=Pedobacter nyackensis TaxID=475255 RepID=UPI002930570D|nr:helix-turn-helix transcriptional regulator [Pedobacter nyackensis]